MGRAYCCEICDSTDPRWEITRVGDVVVSWACDADLATVCDRLQRDSEITELRVSHLPKRREWAQITRALDEIAGA